MTTTQRPASQAGPPEEGPRQGVSRLVRSKAAIKAAITIQTAYRAWDARHKYLGLLARRRAAAISIQSVVRAHISRARLAELARRRAAAISIQSVVRAHISRVKFSYVPTLVEFSVGWNQRNVSTFM